jgi:ATP/maltotriose-dependent transcriptional regulator MalT/two-component SAPR family response regulator
MDRLDHPLMISKIQPPRRRPDLLRRPRLVNFLHSHLDQKLIMISATAGYGKTSLLVDFASDTDIPVCWYTLDAFDRDLRVFLDYFIAAIAFRYPGFGKQTRHFIQSITNLERNFYPIVATLVQEIYEAIPEYFILILDDHHTIENQDQINEFIDLFVQYVDENCHLVIASRALPALPNLALLVARRQAVGLSIDELRFTAPELQELIQKNYGMTIHLSQAEKIVQQSGGWITGLLLTAIPDLQKNRQSAIAGERASVDLYDYFQRQVLYQQSPELQDFLLATSVLDEFNSDDCEQVLRLEASEELITEILLRSLFVMSYEGETQKLRYHDLFRDFLNSHLKKAHPARFRQLNIQAAEFYARLGEWERALSRYLAVKEYGRAADILEQVLDHWFASGRWETLVHWIENLPEQVRLERPGLLIVQGKILAEQGENERALALFTNLERRFQSTAELARLAETQVLQGAILRYQGRYEESIHYSQRAIEQAQPSPSTLAMARKNIGLCQVRLGEIKKGRSSLEEALRLYQQVGHDLDVGMTYHDLGLCCEMEGDLNGAIHHYRAALKVWNRLGNLSPWANTLNGLGVIYYLQGKYEQSASLLAEAIVKARQARDRRIEAHALASLADLKRDTILPPTGGAGSPVQDDLSAGDAYRLALEISNQIHLSFLSVYALDGLANMARLSGEFSEASRFLEQALEMADTSSSAYLVGLCQISQGILQYENGCVEAARLSLERALQVLQATGFIQLQSRAWLHLAQVAFIEHDLAAARQYLEKSLSLSNQLGFDQYLVVEGRRLQPLLRWAVQNQVMPGLLPGLWQRIQQDIARLPRVVPPPVKVEAAVDLKIYAFGNPRVVLNGQVVQWVVTKSRDLLYFLLQNPEGLTRDQIGAQFWPEHSPEKLESAFRSTIYRLRRDLARDCVVYEDGLYRFNRSYPYSYDVELFELNLRRVEMMQEEDQQVLLLEGALDLYRGNYLQTVYEDWCNLEREHLRVQYQSILEKLALYYARHENHPRVIELFQRLLQEDPYREAAHRELMRCYYLAGDRPSALRQFKTCSDLFGKELGLHLSPETQAVYQQIIQ